MQGTPFKNFHSPFSKVDMNNIPFSSRIPPVSREKFEHEMTTIDSHLAKLKFYRNFITQQNLETSKPIPNSPKKSTPYHKNSQKKEVVSNFANTFDKDQNCHTPNMHLTMHMNDSMSPIKQRQIKFENKCNEYSNRLDQIANRLEGCNNSFEFAIARRDYRRTLSEFQKFYNLEKSIISEGIGQVDKVVNSRFRKTNKVSFQTTNRSQSKESSHSSDYLFLDVFKNTDPDLFSDNSPILCDINNQNHSNDSEDSAFFSPEVFDTKLPVNNHDTSNSQNLTSNNSHQSTNTVTTAISSTITGNISIISLRNSKHSFCKSISFAVPLSLTNIKSILTPLFFDITPLALKNCSLNLESTVLRSKPTLHAIILIIVPFKITKSIENFDNQSDETNSNHDNLPRVHNSKINSNNLFHSRNLKHSLKIKQRKSRNFARKITHLHLTKNNNHNSYSYVKSKSSQIQRTKNDSLKSIFLQKPIFLITHSHTIHCMRQPLIQIIRYKWQYNYHS